jgi:regulator of protease activity HflC (stomatin/prohibitin superfamily)
MNDNEREMDLALSEAEQENRLLRARNERLEREILSAADAEAARIYADGMVTVGHMRQKIAAEREACAKVCDDWPNARDDGKPHRAFAASLARAPAHQDVRSPAPA